MNSARRRLASVPLWAHLAAIAFVLVALFPMLDDGLFSADEGALLAQVDLLDRTGEWTAANPAPDIDPEIEALPVELALRLPDGRWAPFAKHAGYVASIRLAGDVGGGRGPAALSIVGTFAAAVAAALLARRLAPGTEAATGWLVAVGSPLLFDGYLTMAHSVAAAFAAFAALAAVGAADRERPPGRRFTLAAIAGVLALAGSLVRTEAVLFAIALGVALAVASASTLRRPDPLGTVLGAAVAAAGPAAYLLGARLDDAAWGGPALASLKAGDRTRPGWLTGRLDGFLTTWVRPAYDGAGPLLLLTGLGVLLLWTAAILIRRKADPPAIALFAAVGAGLVVLRLFAGPALVPGLLVAFPALAGVIGLDRETMTSTSGRLLAAAAGLFAVAVLATQYPEGGAGEWGGRYFALGLPVAAPLVVVGLRSLARAVPVDLVRRVFVGSFAAAAAALSVAAVLELREAQAVSTDVVARVDAIRRDVGGGEPAVLLTTTGAIARFSWDHLDEGRWHTVSAAALPRYSARLAALGEPIVLFAGDPEADLAVVETDWVVEPIAGRTVYRLTPR